jgi:nucleoside-diphosphate-sugar epimerase
MSLKLVILGCDGLVGARLSGLITANEKLHISPSEEMALTKVVLFDRNPTCNNVEKAVLDDPRVEYVSGDLTDGVCMRKILSPDGCTRVTTIHLAALLSGYSEDDFDLGMKVNLFGTLNVMEIVRSISKDLGAPQIYCYVSTDYVACFNEYNQTHPVTEESFRLSPVSYGCQKACNELLISDYTRKGFLDGRVGRLSAVIGRPGFSNSISYPYTGIFTQPLEGKDYDVPLPMEVPYPCSSLKTDAESLLFMATKVDSEKIGHNRVIQIACKSMTLKMIWEACQEVAAEESITLGKMNQVSSSEGKTTCTEINVCPNVSDAKAASLGFPMEVDLKEIIRDYVNRYIKK